MATRIYIPSALRTTFINPAFESFHDDTSIMTRTIGLTSKQAAAARTLSYVDSDNTDQDIGFLQVITRRLTPGQTIAESQVCQCSMQVLEDTTSCNLFMTFGLRVVGADGVTTNKVLVPMQRDDAEASASALTSRAFGAFTEAIDYVTVAGDRLVSEHGLGGDPTGGSNHRSSMRLGGINKTDLGFSDIDTVDRPPWYELTDTLTFLADPVIVIPGKTTLWGGVNLRLF